MVMNVMSSKSMAARPWLKMLVTSAQWLFTEPGGPYSRRTEPHHSKAASASGVLKAMSPDWRSNQRPPKS